MPRRVAIAASFEATPKSKAHAGLCSGQSVRENQSTEILGSLLRHAVKMAMMDEFAVGAWALQVNRPVEVEEIIRL